MNRLGDQMPFGVTAVAIWLTLYALKRVRPEAWEKIPKRYRFLLPMLIGYGETVTTALLSGVPLQESLITGLFGVYEGVASMAVHQGAKASPLPYGTKKDNEDDK